MAGDSRLSARVAPWRARQQLLQATHVLTHRGARGIHGSDDGLSSIVVRADKELIELGRMLKKSGLSLKWYL
ncbi:hypothetical protein BS78_07G155200 [Paspalum vaginatum]|nr:hypothetical protein BS78_07G155200 [Paspalum vaginatum]